MERNVQQNSRNADSNEVKRKEAAPVTVKIDWSFVFCTRCLSSCSLSCLSFALSLFLPLSSPHSCSLLIEPSSIWSPTYRYPAMPPSRKLIDGCLNVQNSFPVPRYMNMIVSGVLESLLHTRLLFKRRKQKCCNSKLIWGFLIFLILL